MVGFGVVDGKDDATKSVTVLVSICMLVVMSGDVGKPVVSPKLDGLPVMV